MNEEKGGFFKKAILGVLIGIAAIVPGISGSTIMVIFKMYDKILEAIASIFKKFKYSILFLLPIVIGAVVGVVGGFFTIKKLLDIIPFGIVATFAGLMVGAFPSLKDELPKAEKPKPLQIVLLIVGFILPVTIAIVSIILVENSGSQATTLDIEPLSILKYFIIGLVVAITQFLPGASSSAIIMAFGYFTPLVESVSLTYWKSNPEIFIVYLVLVVGFLVGCLGFSASLNKLIKKSKTTMYFLFIGLSIGSIVSMMVNPEMIDIYQDWATNGVEFLDLFLGIGLFVCGVLISYQLVRYMRKKGIKEN